MLLLLVISEADLVVLGKTGDPGLLDDLEDELL